MSPSMRSTRNGSRARTALGVKRREIRRRVERDHVVLAAGEERAVALARHEDPVVALHVDDLGVTEHGPQPVPVVARERALRPQLPERLVHRRQVDVERGVEEVGHGRS